MDVYENHALQQSMARIRQSYEEIVVARFRNMEKKRNLLKKEEKKWKAEKKELKEEKKRLKYMLYDLLKSNEQNKEEMKNIMQSYEE
jgi:hypothetical protein